VFTRYELNLFRIWKAECVSKGSNSHTSGETRESGELDLNISFYFAMRGFLIFLSPFVSVSSEVVCFVSDTMQIVLLISFELLSRFRYNPSFCESCGKQDSSINRIGECL